MSINWNLSLYKTGIKFMDDEHQQLYDALCAIRDAYGKEDEENVVSEVLDFLISYGETHFKGEEQFMKSISFEGYEQHRQQHDVFINTCKFMQKMLNDEGFSRKLLMLIYNDVYKWLVNHISDKDVQIAKAAVLNKA